MLDDWTVEKNASTNPDVQYHRLFAESSNLRGALLGRSASYRDDTVTHVRI